jgi:conjugative relaxase-like TrwC/TraI family protein
MLSVATVRSAGGAAAYFAKDDYYAGEHASEVSAWGGQGAADLGLIGEVGKQIFEDLLTGRLPDGQQVGDPERRRAGIDLTFSMPKSASVLAYVAGDERLLAAHMDAVRQTMGWVEKTFAEGRTYDTNRKGNPARTEHLTYAMFQHDTSRKLDPQAHIHVIIANLTKVAGEWRALHNEQLWKSNSIIGSVYHAGLRTLVEELGYETSLTGKHGQFEIEGVPRHVLTAFSQRREQVLAKSAEIGILTPQGRDAVVVRTRDAKVNLEDRDALRAGWADRAAGLGFDGAAVVSAAEARVGGAGKDSQRIKALHLVATKAAEWAENLREWLRPSDPLLSRGMARLSMSPAEIGAEMAVASAIRILGQREAAFAIHNVSRTALDLGIKGVTIKAVEDRIAALAKQGALIFGRPTRADGTITHVTTPEHLAEERNLLAGIDEGRGKGAVIVAPADAASRLQAQSPGLPLGPEQLAAGVLALSSLDRVVVIQGVAGAGKTSLISSIADVARQKGKEVLGLAQANTMVAMLKDEAGISAQTVSSFVNDHLRAALIGGGEAFEASRAALKDTILVLDEASLVANKPMNDLVTIANRLGLDRLLMIGDRAQLQPIDAGKAFTLVQSHNPAMARMEVSHRQRTEHMQAVAALTRAGEFAAAFGVLGDRVVSAGGDFRQAAAKKWLELSAEDRETTALYASGRETRSVLNALVQDGLKADGTLRGEGLSLTLLDSVHLTREELRYAHNYQPRQVLEVVARDKPAGLEHGSYQVLRVSRKGVVTLRDGEGNQHKFRPDQLDPLDKRDLLSLSERESFRFYEGDRVRWTANDKARGLLSSAEAEILSISKSGVEVKTADGSTLLLEPGDRMLSRLGLSYAINMHQAQGMTTEKGIGVMHSAERHLSSQRLAHVMATRVRDDLTIFTNDRDQLLRTIGANPGDKTSAIETVNEHQSRKRAQARREDRHLQPMQRDPFAVDPLSMRAERLQATSAPKAPELDVPEIDLELGL